jgi:hypothetical protein
VPIEWHAFNCPPASNTPIVTHTFIYCQCQPHSHTYNLNYNKHSFFTSI